jgi:hypothetical protein
MANKRDYRQTRAKYKTLVAEKNLPKLDVASSDTRARAELLDAVEDFFRGGPKSITPEKDRAVMTMMIMSAFNSEDDLLDANSIDWSNVPTSKPREAGKVYISRGTVKIS